MRNYIINNMAYDLYVEHVNSINNELKNNGEDLLCPTCRFVDFISVENNNFSKKYYDKVKLIIRKDKVKKIVNGL